MLIHITHWETLQIKNKMRWSLELALIIYSTFTYINNVFSQLKDIFSLKYS